MRVNVSSQYFVVNSEFITGMGIESKRIRKWLASSTFSSLGGNRLPLNAIEEPPSYSGSFNPFPALVIGVTGAAMAAHFQPYVFEVGFVSPQCCQSHI